MARLRWRLVWWLGEIGAWHVACRGAVWHGKIDVVCHAMVVVGAVMVGFGSDVVVGFLAMVVVGFVGGVGCVFYGFCSRWWGWFCL